MVDIKVYGVHSRDENIMKIKQSIGLKDDDIFYDDRPNGGLALYTAKKAWFAPIPDNVTHRLVLPDDVEVCNDFWNLCEKITSMHPDAIFSLYPPMSEKKLRMKNTHTPYMKANGLAGIGVIMPVKYIDECFDFIKRTFNDEIEDDYAMDRFAVSRKIPVLTTVPALLQHIGDDSILTPGIMIRRTVYYDPNPQADWDCKDIGTMSGPDWFYP